MFATLEKSFGCLGENIISSSHEQLRDNGVWKAENEISLVGL